MKRSGARVAVHALDRAVVPTPIARRGADAVRVLASEKVSRAPVAVAVAYALWIRLAEKRVAPWRIKVAKVTEW